MIFGTDGIRGTFGQAPLNRGTVERLSSVIAAWLPERAGVVLGSDTRASCAELKAWIACRLGDATLFDLGVVPTPAVAFETRRRSADLGIMITASHNPAKDNGLKFFDRRGLKIPRELAEEWSQSLESGQPFDNRIPNPLTTPVPADGYRDLVLDRFGGGRLRGMRLAFDFANGAAAAFAKELLVECGVTFFAVGDRPDGDNINDGCGALFPGRLEALTAETEAVAGFALDGDGDRLVVTAPRTVRGDVLLYALFRLAKRRHPELPALVGTVLCGLGLEQALKADGCELIRTQVGDQHVLEELMERGLPLGGEPSGHIIQTDFFPAGDGLLAALAVAQGLRDDANLLRSAAAAVPNFPTFEHAYPIRRKPPLEEVSAISTAANRLNRALTGEGRMILRYSGTEPKLRLFVEARDLAPHHARIRELESTIQRELG